MRYKKRILILAGLLLSSWLLGRWTWDLESKNPEPGPGTKLPFNTNSLQLLKTACFDCHSYESRIPFYAQFFPASIFITDHIKHGRSELNLSEWQHLSLTERFNHCRQMIHSIKRNEMPLSSYTLLHPEARLNKNDKEQLIQVLATELSRLKAALIKQTFQGQKLRIKTSRKDSIFSIGNKGTGRTIQLYPSELLKLVKANESKGSQLFYAENPEEEYVPISQNSPAVYGAFLSNAPPGIFYCILIEDHHRLIYKDLNTFQDYELFHSHDSILEYDFNTY